MDRLAAYNKLNRSFPDKYIFNFGSEGGFYSEFNNMVFAIIYCLKHKRRFVLYSGNSRFKVSKGWDDLFEPFVDEVNSRFHKKFNKRLTAPKLKLRHYPANMLFRLLNPRTKLTYELFHDFFNKDFDKEQFDIPELGLKGNLRDVSREIVEMIYRFNTQTNAQINALIAGLGLPQKYTSVNVRRGDKDTEFGFVPANGYIDKIKELSDLKDIFILTDDYGVVDELKQAFPAFKFYTLVRPDERGYVHSDFIKQTPQKKKNELIKLFASLEVMRRSQVAVGTYTTNPGAFLGMTMPDDKFISVQKSSWYQFDNDDVKDIMVK